MKALRSYPKVWNLGHPAINDLFYDINDLSYETVVVQEKVDGSQFSFGVVDGTLYCRSKGAMIYPETADNLFKGACETAVRLHEAGKLTDGWTYRGEALWRAKHNALEYGRVPEGNVILFDVDIGLEDRNPDTLYEVADDLGLEAVPLIHQGEVEDIEALKELLDRESILGGCKVEGIVIKNYARFGEDGKMLMGKIVSKAFREKHDKAWKKSNPSRSDILEDLKGMYRSERRWEKTVERFRDDGELEHAPQDIGKLIKAVQSDVREECEEEIKAILFDYFWPKVRGGLTAGLPEWYKRRLAERQFQSPEEDPTS